MFSLRKDRIMEKFNPRGIHKSCKTIENLAIQWKPNYLIIYRKFWRSELLWKLLQKPTFYELTKTSHETDGL